MKLKSLMALAIALLCSAGAWAQTDVTSTYITNPSFEADGNTVAESNSANEFATEWTAVTFSDARHAIFNSSSTSADNVYGSSAPSDGTYYLFIRSYGDKSKTQNIQQKTAMPLPKGKYQVSFDYKAARTNNTGRTLTISAKNGSTTKGSKAIAIPKVNSNTNYFSTGGGKDWTSESFVFVLEETTDIKLDISCQTNQKTQVLLDNFVLNYFNINGDALAALIAQATSINMAQGGLSEAITTAQGVYDGIDNTPAYQATIDDAITTLKSAITTKVAGITMHHGDDLSYLIANAGFEGITAESESYSTAEGKDYSTDGWILDTTCDSGQGAVLTYDTGLTVNGAAIPENDNAGNSGKALGLSVGWGGTQLYKTAPITLPAGKYNFKVYGYNAGTSTTLTSKFGFAPTSGGAMLSTKTSYTKGEWGSEEVTIELAEPTEGCFQLGGVAVSGSGSGSTAKVFFDNITLTYINELAEAQEQWQAVHDALEALDATALPDAAEAAITTELAKAVPTTTVDAVNEAKAALQALIDSYAGIKAAYDKVNALITLATSEKEHSAGDADAKNTLNTAINTAKTNKETRTTADALNGDYTTLENARQTYVISGAEPAAGYPFDWTFKLKNSSFESGTTGWTLSKETTGAWTYEAESYDPAPVDGVRCLNAWSQQINYIEVYQNVTLPMGSYSFKGYLYSTGKKAQHIYAYITSDNSSSNLSTSGSWEQLTANFTQSSSSDTSVKLGIYSQGNNINNDTYGWFRADYFQLFYNGTKPVLNDAISSANDVTTSEINVGIGDFQIPTTAKTTLEGKITEAQEVYTSGDAYGSTIQNAISTLNAAVDTFWGSELNAPAEDDVFNLYLDDGLKKTVTFKAGNETSGGYAIGYTDDAGSFYNQAIHFQSTETKNQYKLYIIDDAGTKHYLCTGTVYGGNNSQIRVTDNEENALAVEVIATTTNGIYNLKNTVAGALIGSNGDTGVYTAQTYKNFNINPAAKCVVPVAVNSGKWSTRIFPFAVAEIPDGLEVYTATGISGASIVMSDALSSIPANTPVLIKATKNVDVTLQGYGTATAVSYTEGLLTGFYTAKTIDAGNYVLQTQGGVQAFYILNENATANQVYRAYLTVLDAGDVKAFYFDFNDATAISETLAPTGRAGEGPIFNLAGQKMSKLQKGVNIVNGKKVLVK